MAKLAKYVDDLADAVKRSRGVEDIGEAWRKMAKQLDNRRLIVDPETQGDDLIGLVFNDGRLVTEAELDAALATVAAAKRQMVHLRQRMGISEFDSLANAVRGRAAHFRVQLDDLSSAYMRALAKAQESNDEADIQAAHAVLAKIKAEIEVPWNTMVADVAGDADAGYLKFSPSRQGLKPSQYIAELKTRLGEAQEEAQALSDLAFYGENLASLTRAGRRFIVEMTAAFNRFQDADATPLTDADTINLIAKHYSDFIEDALTSSNFTAKLRSASELAAQNLVLRRFNPRAARRFDALTTEAGISKKVTAWDRQRIAVWVTVGTLLVSGIFGVRYLVDQSAPPPSPEQQERRDAL